MVDAWVSCHRWCHVSDKCQIPQCGYDTRSRSRQLSQHPGRVDGQYSFSAREKSKSTSNAWPHVSSCDRPVSDCLPESWRISVIPARSQPLTCAAVERAQRRSTVCDRLAPQVPSTSTSTSTMYQLSPSYPPVRVLKRYLHAPVCHCLGTPLSPAFTCRNGSRASKAPPNQRPPWPSPNTLTTQAAYATTCLAGLCESHFLCKAGRRPPATTTNHFQSHRVASSPPVPCFNLDATAADQLDPHSVPSTPSCDGSAFVT
ncbi:hypothetical protein CKAH01_06654 [Colletotrichum kahawae]|uniref:Uncharacterized protein n=1 Tax=Colletotrichum kahawae TaxID=34407 RepID=A0AAD9Y9G9_COLKA|nr:hypothetical protein CKAH01_06654 [Colletotrichum kahawae]